MKISIVSPSLAAGGAERAVSLLARCFLNHGHDVSLITISGKSSDFYKLPEQVRRLALDEMTNSSTLIRASLNNLRRIRLLKRAVKLLAPDLVISHTAQTNVLSILSLLTRQNKLIVVEHSDPKGNVGGKIWHLLRRLTYPRADYLVTVSNSVHQHFEWISESKKTVIHNLVDSAAIGSLTDSPPAVHRSNQIAAMGRLIPSKGFEGVLKAFKDATTGGPNWQLAIMGEGESRSGLETMIEQLGLTKQVRLLGLVDDPFTVLRQSKFFVTASESEGFPYAVLEAMACGLPVIALDRPGARDIIRHGVDGLLVRDLDGLTRAIVRLMNDGDERRKLGISASEVSVRFGPENIIQRWEDLFVSI